jgi:glutaredoxin
MSQRDSFPVILIDNPNIGAMGDIILPDSLKGKV